MAFGMLGSGKRTKPRELQCPRKIMTQMDQAVDGQRAVEEVKSSVSCFPEVVMVTELLQLF
uniref:Uncharacterized protein n=1 Tax=Anguilla anguilla TaxID=7936 RepID=A0A0E9WU47_ANGAN